MALLPRHSHRLEESPRDTFLLLHSQSAKKSLIDALKDASLKTGVATYVNDIIFYENDNAAVVTTCLHGDSLGFAFALRKLRLVGRKGWGTMWTDTGAIAIMKVDATSSWFSPPWWRMENDIVYCLR